MVFHVYRKPSQIEEKNPLKQGLKLRGQEGIEVGGQD